MDSLRFSRQNDVRTNERCVSSSCGSKSRYLQLTRFGRLDAGIITGVGDIWMVLSGRGGLSQKSPEMDRALYLSIPLNVLFYILACVAGLVIYVHFYKCDPLTASNKPISAADQLLPFYIIKVLGGYPGLPDLCICGVFAAALSTVSSGLNSLSSVTMQDLVSPFLESRGYSEKTLALPAKALTLFYGVLSILMTVLGTVFGNLIQAAKIIWAMCGGPVLAIFLLGMLTTRTNEKGALIGLVLGLCTTSWITFGTFTSGARPKILPLSSENCQANSTLFSRISSSTLMSMLPETSTLSTASVNKINTETP